MSTLTPRQQILASLFREGGPHGDLITHLKVHEQVPVPPNAPPNAEASKPRYILLGVTPDAKVKLHKSKRNSNGSFSIGKTWGLDELMAIEVARPQAFAITLNAKSYLWETESAAEQINFLVALVRSFRFYTSNAPLRIIGFEINERPGAPPPYVVPGTSARPPPNPPAQPRTSAPSSNGLSNRESGLSQATTSSAGSRPQLRPLISTGGPRPSLSSVWAQGSPEFPDDASTKLNGGHLPPPPLSDQGNVRISSPTKIRPKAPPPSSSVSGSNVRSAGAPVPPSLSGMTPSKHKRMESGINTPSALRQTPAQAPQSSTSSRESGRQHANVSERSDPFRKPTQAPLRPKQAESVPNVDNPTPKSQAMSPTATSPDQTASEPSSALEASRPAFRRLATRSNQAEHAMPFDPPDNDTILANVEEMLEGFEWKSAGASNAGAGQIEKTLVYELAALESASIHAIIESDDRVNSVIKHLDQSIAELDKLDQTISLYKVQLNVMIDDIDHIESQNKGLQVETSNQRALLAEVDRLLDTFNIPETDLEALAQSSLESQAGVERVERAAVSLYKAILSTRDTNVGDMTAAAERIGDYSQYSSQFCKRIYESLSIMFRFQADLISQQREKGGQKAWATLKSHDSAEAYLDKYLGLILFVKEIDDKRYQQICAAYFATMSDLYKMEIRGHLSFVKGLIRKPTEDELESTFSSNISASRATALLKKRSATKQLGEQLQGGDVLQRAFKQIGPHVLREQRFVTDLLHVTGMESSVTFADYMDLETFFRRGAASHMNSIAKRFKDLKSSMDLIFGFLPEELAGIITYITQRDAMQVVGVLAAIDQGVRDNKAAENEFMVRSLQRQGLKCVNELDKLVTEQIKAIEQTKLTVKKRRGVVPFVSVFPLFVDRFESQLVGADDFPIRGVVNQKYDQIASTMFECLQQMAKMNEENTVNAEDKDQLNYHVVLIENMNHLVTVIRDLQVPALTALVKRARDVYEENLNLYIRMVLRRPLGRLLDFFQGLEQLLKNTPPNEVSLHSAYTRSAAKKVMGSLSLNNLRKAVETLSKRVEKHFTDIENPSAANAALLSTVWQACQDEANKLAGTWRTLLNRCYAESGGVALFTPEEVNAAFKRHKPGTAS